MSICRKIKPVVWCKTDRSPGGVQDLAPRNEKQPHTEKVFEFVVDFSYASVGAEIEMATLVLQYEPPRSSDLWVDSMGD